MSQNQLTGVFAPVSTPFENDRIRFDWLEENLKRYAATELSGYLALGTNGEFKSLTEKERIQIIELCGRLKGDKVLMVGTGCESTRETIEFSNRAADSGADFASILPPHYFASKMNDAALISFYNEVAERSKIPVLMYNIPKCTSNVAIKPAVVKAVSSGPNIAGVKDSGGASIFSFLVNAAAGFTVLAGSANYFFPALMAGAAGGVISLANSFPEFCCDLYTATISADLDKARKLHSLVIQANAAVSGKYGVAGVKASMDLAGYHGGDPRRPLLPISNEQRDGMRRELIEIGLLKQEQSV